VFLGVDDNDKAKTFYENILQLKFIGDENGTLLFALDDTVLRISMIPDFAPQAFTVLGWNVTDIESAVNQLQGNNVEIIQYPHMPQDENGIATLGNVRIVWFKDPAGNVLSLTEMVH
ncbi:MAG: VOC family protein, partial [Chloroflexota bacterium]